MNYMVSVFVLLFSTFFSARGSFMCLQFFLFECYVCVPTAMRKSSGKNENILAIKINIKRKKGVDACELKYTGKRNRKFGIISCFYDPATTYFSFNAKCITKFLLEIHLISVNFDFFNERKKYEYSQNPFNFIQTM